MWKALVTGEVTHRFSNAGAGLLISRMRRSVEADPSNENLTFRIQEVREFFAKYECILTHDIQVLFR
jgi:hypothetical protein